jgi:hypothetical protein
MRSLSLAIVLALAAVAPVPTAAQETGLVLGRLVAAGSKSPVAKAAARLVDESSGREVRRTTDEQGRFTLVGVRPGLYRLEVERDGFAPVEVLGIEVRRAGRIRLNLELTPWDEAPFKRQTIVYRRPLVNTEDATLTTTIAQ